MPYDTLPPNIDPLDRYDFLRTRLPDDTLVRYWSIWAGLAAIASSSNVYITYVILKSPTLRSKLFNKFILALALPDMLFSGACAISCGEHSAHGQWFGGSAHCAIQSAYVVFGFAASIWMNVVIAWEMRRLAVCALNLRPFTPLSNRDMVKRVLAVYSWAAVLVILVAMPSFPVSANATFGLACVPLQHDVTSEIVFWIAFIPALFVIPLLLVIGIALRTYWLFPRGFFSHGSATSETKQLKEVFGVFARLLVALVFLWGPTALFIWAFPINGHIGWIGGSVSHFQGLASAYLYSQKPDIRAELGVRFACLSQFCLRFTKSDLKNLPSQLDLLAQENRGVKFALVEAVLDELSLQMTTCQVVFDFVKPKTAESKSSYVAFVFDSNKDTQRTWINRANIFVSHSWLFQYATLVDILYYHAQSQVEKCHYYLDIFAINQHDVTKEGELDQLGKTVVKCGMLLLASSPWSSPLPLTRVWCLYELHVATTNKVPIEVWLSGNDTDAFYDAVDGDGTVVQKALSTIDARSATATVLSDRDMIFELITDTVGFDVFNGAISEAMRSSFAQLAMRRTLLACVGSGRPVLQRSRTSFISVDSVSSLDGSSWV